MKISTIMIIALAIVIIVGAFLIMHKSNTNVSPNSQIADQISGVSNNDVSSVGSDISNNDSDFSDNSLDSLG